jgi:hypothetical protein
VQVYDMLDLHKQSEFIPAVVNSFIFRQFLRSLDFCVPLDQAKGTDKK